MFSALKKLVGSEQPPGGRDKPIPAGLQSMNQALQRRFAKGVQYNMKIVIRGDRNTGKTTLWHRLQGKKFVEEYIPTQEIQVTSIHWNYKTTDDIVKVEVWDVVDKGKGKKRGDGLKLENDPQDAEAEMALDAEFLDVYKNCNGVVMMFDITKQWTFNYILRELPKVPNHVPVCVLGNYRDMGEHRVILPDSVREFIDNLNRPPGSSYFRYAESSMKNSFGLKYLHKFFNIPFLQLQRETLLRQLETNQLDIDATLEELSVQQETEDQNYEIFLEMMEFRSRGHASPLATNGQSPSSGSQSPLQPQHPAAAAAAAAAPVAAPTGPREPVLPAGAPRASSASPRARDPDPFGSACPRRGPGSPTPRRGIIARLFGSSPAPEAPPPPPDPAAGVPPAEAPPKVQSVEDFVPDDSLDRSFLDDAAPQREKGRLPPRAHGDSDSDRDAPGGNPLVAGFQDDLDIEDRSASKPSSAPELVLSQSIALSSEEEEEEKAEELSRSSRKPSKALKPTAASSGQASDLKSPAGLHLGLDQNSSTSSAFSLPPLVPETAALAKRPSKAASSSSSSSSSHHGKASASKPKGEEKGEESESDSEGPIATQMLSFVMDDPDFESEESDSQRKVIEDFPVREDLSDTSGEDAPPAAPWQPAKPVVHAFKPKTNEADLFGLGLEEPARKENGGEEKEKQPSKEEKKKKKKRISKEEEEKSGAKKKHKPKKVKEKEDGPEEKERKKRKKPRSGGGRDKNSQIDELEAFLGGGGGGASAAAGGPSKPLGGGDYEEL
ncbi:hypothetical protein JRQ81_008592 [Phrynocephalus forsythii]|uniref:Rab-like protein 6 n=1 Tax=Phrynocephalus forsythii TaxID=171643 RepID=A0A9Q0XCD4_9SAUR|nr:hypothetical protein JRQ81_008592 [Phrynocephalus forsythii]